MEHFKWSVEVFFRVLRVSSFNDLYCAPRSFLLTLTTVNVDKQLLHCMCLEFLFSVAILSGTNDYKRTQLLLLYSSLLEVGVIAECTKC